MPSAYPGDLDSVKVRGPIVALDVHYEARRARVGCVAFRAWSDEAPVLERAIEVEGAPAAYAPGAFYLRELPYLLAAVRALRVAARVWVIDGYVTLAGGKPGLGARFAEAIGAPVVGVAKNEFHGGRAARVLRGASKKPLFVTAAGVPLDEAEAAVRAMHGPHRIPTLLARADRLARGG